VGCEQTVTKGKMKELCNTMIKRNVDFTFIINRDFYRVQFETSFTDRGSNDTSVG